jgi:hypothetical protein
MVEVLSSGGFIHSLLTLLVARLGHLKTSLF